jgi:hypothetical protein
LNGSSALSQGRYLHREIKTQKKRGQTSVPRVGFEPMVPVFERAKAFHVLKRAATVIANFGSYWPNTVGNLANGDVDV